MGTSSCVQRAVSHSTVRKGNSRDMDAVRTIVVISFLCCIACALAAVERAHAPDPPIDFQSELFYFSSGVIYRVSKTKEETVFLDVGYPSATGFASNSRYLFWSFNNGSIYYTLKSYAKVEEFNVDAFANYGLWADESYLYFPTTLDMRRASIVTRTISVIASAPESAHFTTFGKYQNNLHACATPKNSVSNNEIWDIDILTGSVSSLVGGSTAYGCQNVVVNPLNGTSWWLGIQPGNDNICFAYNDGSGSRCISYYGGGQVRPGAFSTGSIMYLYAYPNTIIEAKADAPFLDTITTMKTAK